MYTTTSTPPPSHRDHHHHRICTYRGGGVDGLWYSYIQPWEWSWSSHVGTSSATKERRSLPFIATVRLVKQVLHCLRRKYIINEDFRGNGNYDSKPLA